ncbi:carboxypeptidase-like regulatory domain-containing protein [Rhodohalobacter sulfatireducens]|uniref:Carboxypeptidase-like regulatory domain-containing protein n=1 Tax=Rhodohalobacter sulfatireducens TaxID=2911366 RepID=A0ABS9KJ96_9BACT|nr:carboxypeptidase-like regulatory domain-containing protein [Rhodohalobacter sulfatireducens]MCG2590923.1 carboxypeptidase-like regulatory domain-containing protein [Rhodohalobacter sulfatireducens]
MLHSTQARFVLLLFLFLMVSCAKEAIDTETFGDIEGKVINSETDQPVFNANITTTPPTNAILTNEDGSFSLVNVPTGSYSIQARKAGFEGNSVNISVREEEMSIANILLSPETEEPDTTESDSGENLRIGK